MNKDELRKQAQDLLRNLNAYDSSSIHIRWEHIEADISKVEAFARALVVRGMKEVKERCSFMAKHYHETRSTDLLMRSTQYNEMIGLSNWIETQIQRIKVDHE